MASGKTIPIDHIYNLVNTIATRKFSPELDMLIAEAISQELQTIIRRKHRERRTIAAS